MRIDRDAFLLAAAALAGCERAAPPQVQLPALAAPAAAEAQRPAAALAAREAAVPEPRRPLSSARRWFVGLSVEQRGNVRSMCRALAADPCAGMLSIRRWPTRPDGSPALLALDENRYLAGMSTSERRQAARYCHETAMPGPACETPLVVAFDRQPVEFAVAGADQFAFVPGTPMTTDWPTPATPWVARDLDGDGAITSGAELFGSSTVHAGGAAARNGFEALAACDANADGTLDARDPAFAELVLWTDRDGDRRSTPVELRPLARVVTAIDLRATLDARCTVRGACEGERSTLRWRDPAGAEHVGALVDIYLPRR
jgi:hypothetical protein